MIIVRNEREGDGPGVRRVLESAFRSSDVADLVDELRDTDSGCTVLVAVSGNEVVGSAVMTPASIEGPDMSGMVLGPVAVHPESQRQGIGTALIWHSVHVCARLGLDFAAVWGAPSFYGRFGFSSASNFHLDCGKNSEFLISELRPDVFKGMRGTLRWPDAFRRIAAPVGY